MALHQIRTDDLTGEPDATTVVITVNGQGIEVDLAAKSADRLTKALAPFWDVGTEATYHVERSSRQRRKMPATNGHAGGNYNGEDYDRAALREWAETNGVTLPQRGRIPFAIVEQYLRST